MRWEFQGYIFLSVSDEQGVALKGVGATQTNIVKLFFVENFEPITAAVAHYDLLCVKQEAVALDLVGAGCRDGQTKDFLD